MSDRELTPYEKFDAYRRGWTDRVSHKAPDPAFCDHAQKEVHYASGWRAGRCARANALAEARNKFGYEPAVLHDGDGLVLDVSEVLDELDQRREMSERGEHLQGCWKRTSLPSGAAHLPCICAQLGRPVSASLTKPEPPPVPNDHPAVWGLVVDDMRARDAYGREHYGTPLQPHNGRDALKDAYQEALDLCVYLRQAIYERDGA